MHSFISNNFPWEATLWLMALIALASLPINAAQHISICPLAQLGFSFCPGCGLGRSITLLFHGDIVKSFNTHPLGFFTVIILSFRIFKLLKTYLKVYGQNN